MLTASHVLYAVRYQILALLVGLIAWQQWLSYHRLSQFKGPFWYSVTNLWLANSILHRRAHLDLYKVYQTHGQSSTLEQ